MTTYRVQIDGKMTGWQRTGRGQGVLFTQSATRDAEAHIRNSAIMQLPGDHPLIDGPVELVAKIYIVPPESWSKKKRGEALRGSLRPTNKPDADNYVKAIMDALNGIAWKDDAQIVDLTVRKIYAAAPGADLAITQVRNF